MPAHAPIRELARGSKRGAVQVARTPARAVDILKARPPQPVRTPEPSRHDFPGTSLSPPGQARGRSPLAVGSPPVTLRAVEEMQAKRPYLSDRLLVAEPRRQDWPPWAADWRLHEALVRGGRPGLLGAHSGGQIASSDRHVSKSSAQEKTKLGRGAGGRG